MSGRVLLLEFLAPDPFRQFRSEEFPFLQGFARAHGIETRWRWVLAGPESRPDSEFVIEPPPDLRDRIAEEVRAFRPTCVVINEAPGPRLYEVLRGAQGLTRIVSIQQDVRRYAMVDARAACEWLGLRAGPGGPLAAHAVPDYASEPLDPRREAPSGFLTVIGGAPCQYRRPIRKNPYFRDLPLAGATRRTGCSFCLGDDRLPAVLRGRAVPLAVLQIARFRETAPADRQTSRYRIAAFEVFWRMAEFFPEVLELDLPPSEFHFACRCDEFLARATELETWLGRLSEHGHSIHLWNMGVENFSQAENERFNKGLQTRQVVEAFERLESLERRWPRNFFFARDGGFSLILFTPWTTIEDLRVNAEWYRRLRVAPVFLRSRLQLRPGTPITRLAQRDRLTARAFPEPSPLDFSCQAYPDEQEVPWRFRHPEVATIYRFMLRVGLDSRVPPEDPLRQALLRLRERVPGFEDVAVLEVLVDCLSSDHATRTDLELCEALENGLRKRIGLRVAPRLADRLRRLLAPARCGGPRTLAGYQVAELREGARDGGPDDVTLALVRGAHRVEFSILADGPGLPAAVRAGGFRATYAPAQAIEHADRLFAVLREVLVRLRS